MKTPRKLTSLLLALLLVFALAATAAAEEGTGETKGTITVDNPIEGQDYTAYKIFDVVYDNGTPTGNYSYTIDSTKNSDWFNTVQDYAGTEGSGLTLTRVTDTDTYVVTTTDDFSAPKFAAALKAAVKGKTGKPLSKAEGANTATVSGLPLGYYFVTSTSGALCNLTTTDNIVTIHDKNDMPFKKDVDKTNVDVGQDVTFTITGKVPDHTGFTKYTYLITDTMSKGLTFNSNSVKVTIGDADATDYTTTVDTANPNKFTVLIPVLNRTIGAEIKVTYTATVNKDAIAVISDNEAKLTYSNDPTKDTTKDSESVKKEVYTSKIIIDKVEKVAEGIQGEPKKLSGAEFVLYKEVTPDGATSATKQYYKWNTDEEKVQWIAEKDQADVKRTGENGEAFFGGLADGTYYLVETKAPAGYNQLDKPVKVEVHVGEHKTTVTSETQLSVTATVQNQAGTLLPSTGGMGTTVFYVLGAVLVVGAGVLLVTKKRMSRNEG